MTLMSGFFSNLRKHLEREMEMGGQSFQINTSILTVVAKELPKAEHRHCARHIFANWHKSYKGDEMKLLFWSCAKAYNKADFNDALNEMREVDHKAVDAFMACNPNLFCRTFISTDTKTDVIVNNMAETFNAYIIEARAKHLIYMLEDIRYSMMERLVLKKTKMQKKSGTVCPRVQERLELEKEKSAMYEVLPASDRKFQVKIGIDEVSVDIIDRTYTCKKWDLTGIPCSHEVAAILYIHGQAEDFFHDMYKKDGYFAAYNGCISLYPGERHWTKIDLPLNPPPIKVGPATASTIHHEATAQPTRVGRGGRTIRIGRGGGRGGTGSAGAGRGRGGAGRSGFGRGRAPQGIGVLFDDQENPFTNPPRPHRGRG
ncbi:uncharacterized protein LOC141618642 [Silene latifolia]|uniref:uncharacterized protein LOC141618642 n=1 Tax=Silene latifolia TaxID=37657 RepID=UPI003D777220